MAAIFGFMSQWVYARRERSNDIKEIQNLLNSEFIALYDMLMRERDVNKRAKDISKRSFNSVKEREVAILTFISMAGRQYLEVRVWDPIISSGNLIKMNHADIKTIHKLRQRIKHGVKSIMKLDKEMRKKMKIEAGGGICFMAKNGASMRIADRGITDQYLNLCEEVIEKTIDQFKELGNLPWFNYDKIKDIDRKYKRHISKTVHS